MLVADAKLVLYVGYNDDNVLVPGLVTESQEAENPNENEIHLSAVVRQGYVDCRANSDIRNNLAGVYLLGSYDVVLEMRKCILKYRNVAENVLNRAAFRYGTSLVRDLQAILNKNEDRTGHIVLQTDIDELYTLVNEDALGFAQYPLTEPVGMVDETGFRYDVEGFDIYQILALHGQHRTYEVGLVPMVDPDAIIHVCVSPFKK